MKIAIAQINPTIGDFEGNASKIAAFSLRARKRGCTLAVFPELCISGYPPKDLLEKSDFVAAGRSSLSGLVESVTGIGVIVGLVDVNRRSHGNALLNSAVLFENGKILRWENKRLLPTYDAFDEGRYFAPGTETLPFEYRGRKIGLSICEDAGNDAEIFACRRYDRDPVAEMVAGGADLIINISASPFHMGKAKNRSEMLSAICRRHGVPLIFSNQVGGNDSILFDGMSAAYDGRGTLVARAADFREDLIEIDLSSGKGKIHPVSASETESVYRALVMGTGDYVKKCGFKRAVIGLSGGIDSALTAVIAARALGPSNVKAIFMPGRFTAGDNFEDARKLAENLRIEYGVIPIDDLFERFLTVLPGLDGDDPGITEQNLQARIRGTLLMAFSNKEGGLVLTTGNKSELAVGYCTLYGDMTGGLAVLADVPKTLVYTIARFVNGKRAVIPSRILEKAPSAELAPGQTDRDDLPPYEILDRILKAYVEEKKGLATIVKMGFPPELVEEVIRRIDRNEYKRQQAAPCLQVTSRAFGYGRRYPIAQRFTPGPL